jgi:hypothetical protein
MSTPAGGGGSRRPSTTKPGGKPTNSDSDQAPTAKSGSRSTSATKSGSGSTTKSGSGSATKSPSAKGAPAKSSSAKSAPAKSASGKGTGARPAAGSRPGGGGKGRRPVAPVKVNQGRNWGPIGLFTAVAVIALGIVGFAGWQVYQHGRSWQSRAGDISGLVNYRLKDASLNKGGQHAWGPIKYPQSPPVGGTHNFNWQNCMGDIYDAPIASEHAVHSMEHGAVWIAYNPDKLSKADVETLAKKVRGKEYMLMSPYQGLDKPISLQAWGYQLKVDQAADKRIDQFITDLRKNAGVENGAVCSGGITETGTVPHDLGKDQPQQQQPPQPQPTG